MPPGRSMCSAPATSRLPASSQVMLQPNPEAGDQFGTALAIGIFGSNPDTGLAVGAPTEDVGPQPDAGMVTVFYRSFTQTFVQGPGTGGAAEAGDRFGASLGVGRFDTSQGQTASQLAVGAPGEDLGTTLNTGAINILYGADTGLVGRGQVLVQGSPGVADTAESDDNFGGTLAGFERLQRRRALRPRHRSSPRGRRHHRQRRRCQHLVRVNHRLPPSHRGAVLHPRQRRHRRHRRTRRRLGDCPRLAAEASSPKSTLAIRPGWMILPGRAAPGRGARE